MNYQSGMRALIELIMLVPFAFLAAVVISLLGLLYFKLFPTKRKKTGWPGPR